MSDKFRYQYGETHPVMLPVDADTVIHIGDLLFFETDDARPASEQTDQIGLENNQGLFASKFAGIAMQRSQAGETLPIRVATRGVFELLCPSSTFTVGDLVGASEQITGNALENQTVRKILRPELALGIVIQGGTSVISVQVEIFSRLFSAGIYLPSRYTSRVLAVEDNLTLDCDDAYRQVIDPNGSNRNVVLPKEACSKGLCFLIYNSADAAEILTIQASDAATTICTPTQNEAAWVECDGTSWRGQVSATN